MPLRSALTTAHRLSTPQRFYTVSSALQMGWFRKHLCKAAGIAKAAQPSPPQSSPSQQDATTSYEFHTTSECDPELLYRYTSGRWLWNEKKQFARRYVEFDLLGLTHVSKQALGARSCVSVLKLVEGNFSKVFLFTMDDGRWSRVDRQTSKSKRGKAASHNSQRSCHHGLCICISTFLDHERC